MNRDGNTWNTWTWAWIWNQMKWNDFFYRNENILAMIFFLQFFGQICIGEYRCRRRRCRYCCCCCCCVQCFKCNRIISILFSLLKIQLREREEDSERVSECMCGKQKLNICNLVETWNSKHFSFSSTMNFLKSNEWDKSSFYTRNQCNGCKSSSYSGLFFLSIHFCVVVAVCLLACSFVLCIVIALGLSPPLSRLLTRSFELSGCTHLWLFIIENNLLYEIK